MIPKSVPLPKALQDEAPVKTVPDHANIAHAQQNMRKHMREEEKKAKAAKEAEKQASKAEKEAAKTAKEQKKQEKMKQKEQKDKETADEKMSRKRKAENEQSADAKQTTRRRKPRGSALMLTPGKIWDPTGNQGTPKKVKERRKREKKAKQSLYKLRRQKELMPDQLADLQEPLDQNKMPLIFNSLKCGFICSFNLCSVRFFH